MVCSFALRFLERPLATPPSPTPIRSYDDLLRPFFEAEKPRARWRVGTEAEKFGVFPDTGRPVPFVGDHSVQNLLSRLAREHSWSEQREYEGGEVISLRREGASITLEPGAQLELSGAPHESIHQACAEIHAHHTELRKITDGNIVWLGLGFHPFARPDDLPWVPKLRYRIMKNYLPTRGRYALDMMRRTATVQANFDYSSEEDAVRKLRLGVRLQPIVTAMFANSPWAEDGETGLLSRRAATWLSVDPDRSGLLPFAWERGFQSYTQYVEWALDVPMFLIVRESKILKNTGQTFRSFMKDGFEGHRATEGDWLSHVNTLFPEVRLKNTIEVRGADSQRTDLVCAVPALWKGVLYDAQSTAEAEALTETLTYEEVERTRPAIARDAIRAELAGKPIRQWAEALLDIADGGLSRLSHLNARGENEAIHLRGIRELVGAGRCPADVLLAKVRTGESFRADVISSSEI